MARRKKKKGRQPRVGIHRGGRPRNETRYPNGQRFDAQAFRLALDDQEITIRDLIGILEDTSGFVAHRSTLWRWTQHGLYDHVGSAPPLAAVRAIERALDVELLRKKRRNEK